MTPTEQDNELRDHLLSLYSVNFNDGEPVESRVGSRDMSSVSVIVDFVDDFIVPLITADRKRVALEARENISKLYQSELEMHRKFMDSVIANNQLKTTAMYCIKCGTELFNIKEQPND